MYRKTRPVHYSPVTIMSVCDHKLTCKLLPSVKIHGMLSSVSLFSVNNPALDHNPNPNPNLIDLHEKQRFTGTVFDEFHGRYN